MYPYMGYDDSLSEAGYGDYGGYGPGGYGEHSDFQNAGSGPPEGNGGYGGGDCGRFGGRLCGLAIYQQ
ncbi:hypothetical protein V3C99_000468 [Haemonchus contortus]